MRHTLQAASICTAFLCSGAALARAPVTQLPDGDVFAGVEECSSNLYAQDPACPFQWGIASGDPLDDAIIIWTAVEPDPVPVDFTVSWRMSTTPDFASIVASGIYLVDAASAYTVKVDVGGLDSDTIYYYQFDYDGKNSIVGRTRTLPSPNAPVDHLKLALVSCSHMAQGYFNVYARVAERDDLNAVLHLGDYYYEYAPGEYADLASQSGSAFPERTPSPAHEITTLQDYWERHKQYKSDPDLQAAHAKHPFITVWDDHESANDSWRLGAENHQYPAEGSWFDRKPASVTAYYQWMPIREQASEFNTQTNEAGVEVTNEDPVIYRTFRFGTLAELTMLDTRIHERSGPELANDDPAKVMLGDEQRTWLESQLASTETQWKLIGQQVMFGQLDVAPGVPLNSDQWDGYQHERSLIHDYLANTPIDNAVIFTGDIHTSWAMDITANPQDISNGGTYQSLAVEFVTPSVTSPGLDETTGENNAISAALDAGAPLIRTVNPHIKYADLSHHGYVLVDVDANRTQGTWYLVDTIGQVTSFECPARMFETLDGANRLTEVPVDPSVACPYTAFLDEQTGSDKLGVFVVVVDSLMPEEIGATLTPTPNLAAFRDESTWFTESRSVFSGETIPNHVAMMTGMYPQHNGIPTNNFWNRTGTPASTTLSSPTELEAPTMFTLLHNQCPGVRTAAALSKSYLHDIFTQCTGCNVDQSAPDQLFDPASDPTFIPESEHTPDVTTMTTARGYLPDADFMFVNLGDVDRSGHIDESGASGVPTARNNVMQDTDTLFGQFIQDLKDAGRWDKSIVIVVSDHGMDWSTPFNYINIASSLPAGVFTVQNGGTAGYYLEDPDDPLGDTKLKTTRDLLLAEPGVEYAWYVAGENPADPGADKVLPEHFMARHENFGDIVATANDGYRFSEPSQSSNPLPGNHGHRVTLHNTFMIGGGAPFVKHQMIESDDPNGEDHFVKATNQSENIDVGATVAWLLGLDTSGFDGRPLTEAFDIAASPSDCAVLADADGDSVPDFLDNCTLVSNVSQCDTNGDGYGNHCDGDLNNNLVVNFADLSMLKEAFSSSEGDPNWNPDADLNCNGVVNFADLALMKAQFLGPPGPSDVASP